MTTFRRIVADLVTNWRTYDAPVAEKVRLAARNNAKKIREGGGCCGNYGEPGC